MSPGRRARKPALTRQQQQAQATAKRQLSTGRTRSASPTEQPPADAATGRHVPPQLTPVEPPKLAEELPIRYYLDVAAVRIQQWLTRTPDLRGYRGASALLTNATSRATWEGRGRMPRGVCWNDEAGDVAGVVQLTIEEVTVTPVEAGNLLSEAANQVARQLRTDLPQCPLAGVVGRAVSYVDAYPAMEAKRVKGDLVVDSPASPPQLILSKPCDKCRTLAATSELRAVTGDHPDDTGKQVCPDCAARYVATGGTKGDKTARAPHAERVLLQVLNNDERRLDVVGFRDDFAKLALAGSEKESTAPTHLALIYADGNRVGDFVSAAAKATVAKSEIAPALQRATLDALADAVVMIMKPGDTHLPMLPHIVGGDDVAATVPAAHAWAFTIELLTAFSRRLNKLAKDWGGIRAPSMSAGLVFFHRSSPFADAVDDAKRLLKDAKKQFRGEDAAIAFLDLTADGSASPHARLALTVADLVARCHELDEIALLSASHRQVILDLLRRAASPRRGVDEVESDADLAYARLVGQGSDVLIRVARGDANGMRNPLSDPVGRARLRTTLDIARHWRPAHDLSEAGVGR